MDGGCEERKPRARRVSYAVQYTFEYAYPTMSWQKGPFPSNCSTHDTGLERRLDLLCQQELPVDMLGKERMPLDLLCTVDTQSLAWVSREEAAKDVTGIARHV